MQRNYSALAKLLRIAGLAINFFLSEHCKTMENWC